MNPTVYSGEDTNVASTNIVLKQQPSRQQAVFDEVFIAAHQRSTLTSTPHRLSVAALFNQRSDSFL